MSVFAASLSDAELTRSTGTFGCELGRRLEEAKADLAASRALVEELRRALFSRSANGWMRCYYCQLENYGFQPPHRTDCPALLTEADMLKRLETK